MRKPAKQFPGFYIGNAIHEQIALAARPHSVFNRRYQLDTLTERLAYACARTVPHPYRVIVAG